MTRFFIRSIIVPALGRHVSQICLMLLALAIIGFSHSVLIFLIGPLLEAVLRDVHATSIQIADLLPEGLKTVFGLQWHGQISAGALVLGMPIGILFAGFLKSLGSYLFQVTQHFLSLHVAQDYRTLLFEKLLAEPYGRLIRRSPGEYTSMIINDVHFIQSRFTDMTFGVLREVVVVLAALGTMCIIHWQSALFIVLVAPVLGFVMGRIGKNIASFAASWQDDLGKLTAMILAIRRRFEFIRAQHGEAREIARFEERNRSYLGAVKKSLLVRSGFAPWLEYIGLCFFAVMLLLSAEGKWVEGLEGTALFQLLACLGMLLKPLRNIGEQIAKFQETKGALAKSLDLLQIQDQEVLRAGHGASEQGPEDRAPCDRVDGMNSRTEHHDDDDDDDDSPGAPGFEPLILTNFEVGFDGKALQGLPEFCLKPFEKIAVIGASGVGKSSFVKTLAGLYPELLPGASNQAALDWIHRHSSYVSQTSYLFDGSVRENLCYGLEEPWPDDAEIWRAIGEVGLEAVIAAKPAQLDHHLSGIKPGLSGGQIQRLAIARALIQKRPIWLLDEVTSAVDAKTEAELTALLLAKTEELGTCMIVITHRLNYLEHFDEVMFFQPGQDVVRGKHQDLVGEQAYARFISLPNP